MTLGFDPQSDPIPFNRATILGSEIDNVRTAINNGFLSSGGSFSKACEEILKKKVGAEHVILVHTCSAALEMAVALVGIEPGDEVILPSYTFVSAANAVALNGGVPVFVDIDPDCLNIDVDCAAAAITERTKAVITTHYAGVGTGIEDLAQLCRDRVLWLIEDSAHAIDASYRNRPLGSFGSLSTISFHETKNVTSGEGGALLINDATLIERAEVLADKGTDRAQFLRGETQKYVWQSLGSSYRASEIAAAFLLAQLEGSEAIMQTRLSLWKRYQTRLEQVDNQLGVCRPNIHPLATHNAHIYYLIAESQAHRDHLLTHLKKSNIHSVFHYVPLHSSPAGRRYGRVSGPMKVTDRVASHLLRLPLFPDLSHVGVDRVVDALLQA